MRRRLLSTTMTATDFAWRAVLATTCALFAAGTAVSADGKTERGEYIVNSTGCHDCHTPWIIGKEGPEPDMSRKLSGHPASLQMPPPPQLPPGPWLVVSSGSNTAWAGPWGISFTANLTPDPDTGLGQWTLRNFIDTMRTGRRMGRGRPILPPMPTPSYKNFSDQDLEAIYSYLRSIPPIRNQVPDPVLPDMGAQMGKK